jgi:hypothetical protein
MSVPVPRFPDEKNESCDQSDHDKHPVLAFEAQNREMIDEKLHRVRPAFVQRKRFRDKNILFLYYFGWIGPANSCRASAGQGCFTSRSGVERRAKYQQFVKFGGLVTDTIGTGDENLPTFFRKSQPLGGGNDNAQPDRGRGFSIS